MQWISNLSILKKFLLLPIIATILIIFLGIIFLFGVNKETALLESVAQNNVPKLQKMSAISSKLSTNHVEFVSLLASALKEQLPEGSFYKDGRKHIIALNTHIKELERSKSVISLNTEQNKIHGSLIKKLKTYRDLMGNTVLMSSVEIQLVTQHTLSVNEAYDDANKEFLNLIASVQNEAATALLNAENELHTIKKRLFLILAFTLILIVFVSLQLSRIFSTDLKNIIERLSLLSQGDTSISLPKEDRQDEFGAVNDALRIFKSALIKRVEAENNLKAEMTVRIEAEKSLRESEERFRTLYDDNPLILFTIDQNGKIHSINKRGAKQIGFRSEELVGSSVLELVMEEDREEAISLIKECTQTPGTRHQKTLRKSHKDGNVIWLRETGQAIQDRNNSLMLLACEDITETLHLSEQLSHQATHDNLTDLINRWEFERQLVLKIENAKESKTEHILCYVDLDQFKIINDTYGHTVGDKLLIQLSQMLKQHIRTSDTLARLGGDEFGVLFNDCSLSSGWRAANGLLKAIQEFQFPWKDRNFKIGASIGLVQINELSHDANTLLSDADTACYTAKDAGRNRIHAYSSEDIQLVERRGQMQWANEIPLALEEDRFELYYQTIQPLNNNSDKCIYFEILVRLKGEDGQIISPASFLPAAERYNLSSNIDKWVITNTMSMLNKYNGSGKYKIKECAINLSGMSLSSEELLDFILDEIKKNKIKPETICFEITETAAISNLSNAEYFITKLKEQGVRFALDDFGTGLSSFEYLNQLPVDKLKIDGIFIKNIANDPIQLAMVKSINEIGHVMGLQTIAEFVENQDILDKLIEINVDFAQGYHVSKPSPLTELFE
jgi:diguanylate cyclase (GGDEF)-like protein/PAS domain S-box-containing protein